MFDLYLTDAFVPFTIALALLFGLLALELILALLGATLLGLGADADIDVDIDSPDLGDLDIDLGDPDLGDFELSDIDSDVDLETEIDSDVSVGPASWLGMGKVPTLIWLAAVLLGFGVVGVVIQSLAGSFFGSPLPRSLAAIPAAAGAIWFARTFGEVFARLLPKTETTALSERHLGRRTGIVSQGTAKRGMPAEVRVTDHHGNMHFLRAEPVKDDEEIPAGTKVLVLRHRFDHGYRLVALGPAD